MSKVSKILVSLSFAFIVAFSFMFVNLQPLFAKADTISNYNVSFIAPDNSLLYEVNGVPSGVSLQELNDSNLITSYYNGSISYTNSSWSRYNLFDNTYVFGYGNFVYNDITSSITITTDNTNNSYAHLLYYFNNDNYSSLYVNFDVLNSSLTQSSLAVDICSSSSIGGAVSAIQSYYVSYSDLVAGHYSHHFQFTSSSSDYLCLRIYVHSNVIGESISLSNINLSVQNYPFFNFNYINNKLSAYNFSNYYYQYDIDTLSAITSDMYYYPVQFTKQYDTWLSKTWSNFNYFYGYNVWNDGVNYFYSNGAEQYVLDSSTSTWTQKTWNGLNNFVGNCVWSDGTNFYYSNDMEQYVLDSSTSTWTQKIWNGHTRFEGHSVWSDGTNFYFSYNNEQFVLDSSTSTWSDKSWNGYSQLFGSNIWSDGTNFYYSSYSNQYVLNVSTSTWSQKFWNGLNNFSGGYIWTNKVNYFYSNGAEQYVLDSSTSTWSQKTWVGLNNFSGDSIWFDSFGIYYSYNNEQFVLASSLIPLDSDYYYQNGYNDGYNTGYTGGYNTGYNTGYNIGVEEAGNYTFFSLISAVMDAPLKVFYGLFNFELMGVNLAGFIQALLSLAILLFIIRFALQK